MSKILVIDDEPARVEKLDLILLDVMKPDMQGWGDSRKLKGAKAIDREKLLSTVEWLVESPLRRT